MDQANIDVLVMGAYGHTRIRALLVRSTTTLRVASVANPLLH
jgi:nucleotide-binding universal stress UspA family protein